MPAKLQTAVVGATGYAGTELTRLLLRHPQVSTPLLFGRNGELSSSERTELALLERNRALQVESFSWSKLAAKGVELLFLATPHQLSRVLVPEAIEHKLRVIDLSGAWRLKEERHRAVYDFNDPDPETAAAISDKAVYGLPEVNRDSIANANLVANPGCYATSVILALAPLLQAGLVDREYGIISDSKSGVSGAGKEPSAGTHFVAVADNLSAYSVFCHRHLGEIVEQLSLEIDELTFTPHLLPIPRGIMSTIYLRLLRQSTPAEVEACFRDFYQGQRWIRVFAPPQLPQIRFSLHTNYCDIGCCLADDGQRLVLISCIDNLLKGAAGQAVQNMNVMFGWNDDEGLN